MRRKKDEALLVLGIILVTTLITLAIGMLLHTIGYSGDSAQKTMLLGEEFYFSVFNNRNLTPYTTGNSSMTPFVNVGFYMLSLCVPSEISVQWGSDNYFDLIGTAKDLRINQYTLVIYLLFVVFSVVLITSGILLGTDNQLLRGVLLSISCIVSFPMLSAYEIGSVVPYVLALLIFYEIFDSLEGRWWKRISLLLLALVISIEPIFLLFLTVYSKRREYKKVVCVLGTAVLLNIIPVLIYGWEEVMRYFHGIVLNLLYAPEEGINLFSFMNAAQHAMGTSIRARYLFVIAFGLFILAIVSVLCQTRKWKVCLNLVLLVILFSPASTNCTLAWLFYVFFVLLRNEKKALASKERLEILLSCMCLIALAFSEGSGTGSYIHSALAQIPIIVLFFIIVFESLIMKYISNDRRKNEIRKL